MPFLFTQWSFNSRWSTFGMRVPNWTHTVSSSAAISTSQRRRRLVVRCGCLELRDLLTTPGESKSRSPPALLFPGADNNEDCLLCDLQVACDT